MAKVSIIIPTFNSSDLILSTVYSVQAQDYLPLEIIIVDDKSTDDTFQKITELAKDDSRIKIISKQKEGPAIARATGLRAATGEYILFLDSDDLLFPGAIESMARMAEEDESDCVFSDFITSYGSNLPDLEEIQLQVCAQRYTKFKNKYIENELVFQGTNFSELASSTYSMVMWGKLFRKSQIPIESFESLPPYAFGEDFLFNHLLLSVTNRISFWNGTSVMHRLHSNSLTAGRSANATDFAKSAKNAFEMYKRLNLPGEAKIMDQLIKWAAYHLVNYIPLTSYPAFIRAVGQINLKSNFWKLTYNCIFIIIQKFKPTRLLLKVIVFTLLRMKKSNRIEIFYLARKIPVKSARLLCQISKLQVLTGSYK